MNYLLMDSCDCYCYSINKKLFFIFQACLLRLFFELHYQYQCFYYKLKKCLYFHRIYQINLLNSCLQKSMKHLNQNLLYFFFFHYIDFFSLNFNLMSLFFQNHKFNFKFNYFLFKVSNQINFFNCIHLYYYLY